MQRRLGVQARVRVYAPCKAACALDLARSNPGLPETRADRALRGLFDPAQVCLDWFERLIARL